MKILKIVFKFYINSSIHVALAVYALLKITEIYFKISFNEHLNNFVFFGTITGYNFVKYAGVAKLHHISLTDSLKVIQVFSFFCFMAMCYFAFLLPVKTLCITLPFMLLTVLYATPFLNGFSKNLREVSYLKIAIVAFVWAGFTVLIPVVNSGLEFTFTTLLLFLQRFLIVVVLILPFDIRDMQYDAISLQTIPQKIGIEKTKRLGLVLMIFCLILEYLASTSNSMQTPFMLFFFLVLLFLMRAKNKQSAYYSSFFVESLPIIWWFIHLGYYNI